MNAAIAALDTLKQNDISLVKTMTNPPAGVRLVMEAVCIMKGLKPEKKVDGSGKVIEDFWPTSKKVCCHFTIFLPLILVYSRRNIK